MGDSEDVTVEEAITNELQLVNFLLQGGNHARAAQCALRAATLYAAAGRRCEALVVVKWAFDIEPASYTAEQFTLCLFTVGDGIIETFRRAAHAHLEAGRDTEALALLERLVEADSEQTMSRLLLADLWLRKGQNDEAIAQLWAAIDLFERHGRLDGRIEALRRITGIDRTDVAAYRELGRTELLALDFESALVTLTRLLQLRPTDRCGRELLAETLARSHRPGSAVAMLRSLLHQYEGSERYERAAELLHRAVTWNPADEHYCVALDRLAEMTRRALPAPKTDPGSAPLRVIAS